MAYEWPDSGPIQFEELASYYTKDEAMVVAEAIDVAVPAPPRGAVGHRLRDFRTFQVQRGHERVEPRRQAVFVPSFGVE